MICGIDGVCFLSAMLFLVSNALKITETIKYFYRADGDYHDWKTLNPVQLESRWKFHNEHRGIYLGEGIVNIVTWFIFCSPILQVAWILSRGGKRRVGLHAFMALAVIGGSFVELVAKLMVMGREQIMYFLIDKFNTDKWIQSTSTEDHVGIRVIEVCFILVRGLNLWVDAFEWLSIMFITFAIYRSVNSMNDPPFSHGWAAFGVTVGAMALVDFVADILRLTDYGTYQDVAILISFLNTVFLLPIWILWLGRLLPRVRPQHKEENDRFMNGGAHTNGNNGTEMF
mmetsp:Transcript_1446/g.2000  ORF Transcript_1446/g.2000 Transcript_1446/m.2000 type:complete len:285 (+) Transcript_1446:138-992(+)|eukprot:CAMPEP_0118707816 /NCGR_PEP_ID=MMETSP0800-20121206/21459_1 /TAXON_ID=210618 ORGANISM="Striatella unipunctata, Strain CCMP2910" /NCGR_SAMPLE_ID=MMETSP0800 /ASSEMBLY_ACC=CAM_ASM_000638 /LENGTH=284 /DNA_ID=CAMNT_0006610775 /DNA_START=97 /DNA_END=951 /DNA_ORIENTATION=-